MNTSLISAANLSAALLEDRTKTFTSMDENISGYIREDRSDNVKTQSQISNFENNEEEKLSKWAEKYQNMLKKYDNVDEEESQKPSNCYMIKIEEMSDIIYRKLASDKKSKEPDKDHEQTSGKVYLEIIANFCTINKQRGKQSYSILANANFNKKTLNLGVFQLEERGHGFKLQEQIPIYFHLKQMPDKIFLIYCDFTIYESVIHNNIEIMVSQKYLGQCEIDPNTPNKNRQKVNAFTNLQSTTTIGSLTYSVFLSDVFKLLQTLIPPNCLCSAEETIGGLAGGKLPKSLNTFTSQLDYTQLLNFKMDLIGMFVPDVFLKQKLKQAENGIIMHSGLQAIVSKNLENSTSQKMDVSSKKYSTVSTTIKNVTLTTEFHNGWKTVCRSQIKLVEKMQVQKKTTDNSKIGKSKKNEQAIKLHHYIGEELANLPFVFMDEEAALILQVQVKFEVKIKKLNDKEQSHLVDLPICFSLFHIDKMITDEKQVRPLIKGSHKECITPYSNISRILDDRFPHSKVEFYLKLSHKNKNQMMNVSVRQPTNVSIVAANKSQVEFDKIVLEKERMIRQNKKLKQQNRYKKIQLNQEIPLLDTTGYKQELYKDSLQRMREQTKDLEDLLSYLKQKVNEIDRPMAIEPDYEQFQVNNTNQEKYKNFKNYHNSIFYQAALMKNPKSFNMKTDNNCIKLRNFFDSLVFHDFMRDGVPLEVIRTEAMEQNYAYGFLINWLTMLPISNEQRLPRKFYFVVNFYKNRNIISETCKINESTGEIIIAQLKSEQGTKNQLKVPKNPKRKQQAVNDNGLQQELSKKVVYFEVGPNSHMHNDSQNFLEFIGYLYYSALQIKIIDYYSKIQFGQCYLKLKDFLRMRRNQVSFKKELFVYHHNKIKGKLKLQTRSFRKDPKPSQFHSQLKAKIQETPSFQSTQSRQLSRIEQYKRSKNQDLEKDMKLKKIQKIMNEQFIKEQVFLVVTRMKAQIIRLQVINRKKHKQAYTININDVDNVYLKHEEMIVINEQIFTKIKQTKWWGYENTLNPNRNSNILIPDDRNCFELNPGQKVTLLLYFYTQRKFMEDLNDELPMADDWNKVYCRRRCVDITLVNIQTNQLFAIYNIHILPQPECSTFFYDLSRKNDAKLLLEIELPKNDITSKTANKQIQEYVIYIDDPTVLVNYEENARNKVTLQCYSGALNRSSKLEASVLSPLPENKLLMTYNFTIWGAQQIILEANLWQEIQFMMELHNSVCFERGLMYVCVYSEEQRSLCIRQSNPLKINSKQSKTLIKATATARSTGVNYYTVLVKPPLTLQNPPEQTIHRYSVKLITSEPEIKEQLTLRIKLTDKLLEESFGYTNSLGKKMKLKIYSTHQHILWSTSDEIEVQPRGQKKIKIRINAELVTQNTRVILSFHLEKYIQHFLFILELDSYIGMS